MLYEVITDIRFFVVTPEVVKDPKGNLQKILDNPEDPELVARITSYNVCYTKLLRKKRTSVEGNFFSK